MSWWLDNPNPQGLSQGDIIAKLLIGAANHPVKYLAKEPLVRGGKKCWTEVSEFQPFKTDNRGLYIARGRLTFAIVVSHSCELDKSNNNHVLLAPIASLDSISDVKGRESILASKTQSLSPFT